MVRQVSDDVVVMRYGAVVERGPTARVLDEPEHPYTRALLSAVPRRGWKPVRSRFLEEQSPELSELINDDAGTGSREEGP